MNSFGPGRFGQPIFYAGSRRRPSHFEFSSAEPYLPGYNLGTSPNSWEANSVILTYGPLMPVERAWIAFGSQPWARSGGFNPTNAKARSILHEWFHHSAPQVYVCKVPVKCRLCNTTHRQRDRALASVSIEMTDHTNVMVTVVVLHGERFHPYALEGTKRSR